MASVISEKDGIKAGWSYLEHEGEIYVPTEFRLDDGRVRLRFNYLDRQLPMEPFELPRISFYIKQKSRRRDPRSVFCGIQVPRELRGQKLGQAMLHWLIEEGNEHGYPLLSTVRLNKPLIAQLIAQTGYEPDIRDGVGRVEILPSTGKQRAVPTIRWLENTLPNKRMVDKTPQGTPFYKTEGPLRPEEPLQPLNPDMAVYIHTRYAWPEEQQS
ncbi:hypothetical protein CSA80_04860 [Candidatus Saccharibacteria bacterium]|nr:MAG: hypothetical protein CSA80_04860 [Candidatus Saccharibacteria bacterium]